MITIIILLNILGNFIMFRIEYLNTLGNKEKMINNIIMTCIVKEYLNKSLIKFTMY